MMYSSMDGEANTVPAFLTKLWKLVEDSSCDDLISWDKSGNSFHVHDQVRFAKEILPLYFKHKNIASFIRQLNMYGFHKVVNVDQGGLKGEKDDLEFQHLCFVRGQEDCLQHIRRKQVSSRKTDVQFLHSLMWPENVQSPEMFSTRQVSNMKIDTMKLKHEDIAKVLSDMKLWKGKQESLSSKFEAMKKQNEALWREVANLRQKHKQQEKIVNNLLQFLVSLVGHNRLSGMKRKHPLMINDVSSPPLPTKRARYPNQLSIEEKKDDQPLDSEKSVQIPAIEGPKICEVTYSPISSTNVTDDLADHDTLIDICLVEPSPDSLTKDKAQLDISTSLEDLATLQPDLSENENENENENCSLDVVSLSDKTSMSEQLDNMQLDLENLQDILSDSHYIDVPTLLGMFSNIEASPESCQDDSNTADVHQMEGGDHKSSSLVVARPSDLLIGASKNAAFCQQLRLTTARDFQSDEVDHPSSSSLVVARPSDILLSSSPDSSLRISELKGNALVEYNPSEDISTWFEDASNLDTNIDESTPFETLESELNTPDVHFDDDDLSLSIESKFSAAKPSAKRKSRRPVRISNEYD